MWSIDCPPETLTSSSCETWYHFSEERRHWGEWQVSPGRATTSCRMWAWCLLRPFRLRWAVKMTSANECLQARPPEVTPRWHHERLGLLFLSRWVLMSIFMQAVHSQRLILVTVSCCRKSLKEGWIVLAKKKLNGSGSLAQRETPRSLKPLVLNEEHHQCGR